MRKFTIGLLSSMFIIVAACPSSDKSGFKYQIKITNGEEKGSTYYTSFYKIENSCLFFNGVKKTTCGCKASKPIDYKVCGGYQIITP